MKYPCIDTIAGLLCAMPEGQGRVPCVGPAAVGHVLLSFASRARPCLAPNGNEP